MNGADFSKFPLFGRGWRLRLESYTERNKSLISIADRRTDETSGVGLSAILLWLISGCQFRLFRTKVWQTDKHRSDKRQCTRQDPKRTAT